MSPPRISLEQLRRQIAAAKAQYPELARGLSAALADIDRATGQAPAPSHAQRRNRRRLTREEER